MAVLVEAGAVADTAAAALVVVAGYGGRGIREVPLAAAERESYLSVKVLTSIRTTWSVQRPWWLLLSRRTGIVLPECAVAR